MSEIKNPIPEKYRAWIYLAGGAVAILLAPAVGFLEAAGKTEFILPVTSLVAAIGLLVAFLARVNLSTDTVPLEESTPVEPEEEVVYVQQDPAEREQELKEMFAAARREAAAKKAAEAVNDM